MRSALLFLLFFLLESHAYAAQQSSEDWSAVDQQLGRKGTDQGVVHKFSFPRSDLHVRVGETPVEPAAALGSWIAFRRDGSQAVADGDLVLIPEEITPVVMSLRAHNITVTAIHNHLAGETPTVMYVHFLGVGNAAQIAQGLHEALAKTKNPAASTAKPESRPLPDEAKIESILGKKGTENGKVLSFSFPRPHGIASGGHVLGPAMGMATAINFQPSRQGVAATGDFVVKEDQTQALLTALAHADIAVTAMHNHLLADNPRMVFIHFWAEGPADGVARGLKTALEASVR